MNTYQIYYFGLLGERRGRVEETITSSVATVWELYESLAAEHSLGMRYGNLRAAVNDEMVSWEYLLSDGDQVAFLPPMSGG